jgi:hypothetical protein
MAGTFVRRVAGAAMLDVNTFEEVEADPAAMPQAVAVVLLSSAAAGIGLYGARGAGATIPFVAIASLMALTAWGTFAAIAFRIGSGPLSSPATRVDLAEMLRTLGFAAAPGLLQALALFTPWPVLVSALTLVWTMAASVVAVRQALDFTSTWRAVAVCLVGWGLPLAIFAALATVVSGR